MMVPMLRPHRFSERSLSNEKGQMAIFVALTFQVLFVFFAMIVNIGLIVHDKINLQNAVDLAAYYGAQRQAELLNEIAHLNYQIRQDYKLMAWRMRVLGEFGRTAHPSSINFASSSPPLNDSQEYPGADNTAVCVAHGAWREPREVSANQTLCSTATIFIPEIPVTPNFAPFNPINAVVTANINNLRNLFSNACTNQGQLNWFFTANLFAGYKYGIASRKQMIREIAQNLSSDVRDFRDRSQQSVRAGVLETLRRNLTSSNSDPSAFSAEEVKTANSMAIGPCAEPSYWLPDIPIRPYLMYTDNSNAGGACTGSSVPIFNLPVRTDIMGTLDPSGLLRNIAQNTDNQPLNHPYHSILGFEKNPWCVAWYGVRAKTRPRKPFAPFGAPVVLEARSFAQPFGGRIGPWYMSTWPKGATQSAGVRVDPLTAPRLPLATPLTPAQLLKESMPNYSRFPGDPLGLKSMAAIGAMRSRLWTFFTLDTSIRLSHYDNLKNAQVTGDLLPWDADSNSAPPIRDVELAAVAPDLFDMTYYSIEPDYGRLYFIPSTFNRGRFSTSFVPISDIGTRFNPPSMLSNNVMIQMERSTATAPPPAFYDLSTAFWISRKSEHLLTGWTQKALNNNDFPEARFGTCATRPLPNVPTVGNCAAGGRVGYSIRHVSKSYLLFENHRLGGGDASGPLDNPPSSDF